MEYAVPVTVHGMAVHPGDLIHADRHGAVVVPHDAAPKLAAAAAKIAAAERTLIDAARSPDFTVEVLASLLNPHADDH